MKTLLNSGADKNRASGLGRACVVDICRNGGYAAILDMNQELAEELVKEVGGGKTKFFETNVLETESIAAAVKGVLEWVKQTGKEVGGVIAAAGVSTPAKVCHFLAEVLSFCSSNCVQPQASAIYFLYYYIYHIISPCGLTFSSPES